MNLKTWLPTERLALPASITGPMVCDDSGRRVFALAGNSLLDVSLGSNRPPSLPTLGTFSVPVGQSASLTLQATDPDGDEVEISALQLPNGASFNPSTRVLRYSPTAPTPAAFAATFRVSDASTSSTGTVPMAALAADAPAAFLPTGGTLSNLRFGSDGTTLYAANNELNRVERLSTSSPDIIDPIPVGPGPIGLDVEGDIMMICDNRAEFIELVDLTNLQGRSIYVPRDGTFDDTSPYEIAVSASGKGLITSDYAGSGHEYLRDFDLSTGTITLHREWGTVTEPSFLSAAGDRSRIGLAEGNISSSDIFSYSALSGAFQRVFGISAYVTDLVLDQTGQRQAVLPGPVLFDSTGVRLGTATGYQRFAFVGSSQGAAHKGQASIDILRLDTMVPVRSIALPTAATGAMEVSNDGEKLYVICEGGIAVVNLTNPRPL